MNELIASIEKSLLPSGCHFSEEQQSVIYENNDMDVVAGPGTGKTTVLTARIKILLEQLKGSGQGICVLTHTNVAVDEIKSSLKKLGVEEIKNPHFIGTIQDFFNTFFAKKAFHLILGDKQMRVLDDEIFREKFDKQFVRYYQTLIEKGSVKSVPEKLPNPAGKIDKWNFLHEGNPVRVESKVGGKNKQYNNAFNTSINRLFKLGIITNHCCLELSNWYIEQYNKIFKAIISKRFAYLLLDEAQDTSKFQFELLQSLFDNTSVIVQKFGDPYQAIYNIWGGDTELAWEVDDSREKRISKTSRFSETIVDVVKNVCIVKYDDFKSTTNHTSFSPYFIIYEDGDDLIKKYRLLIDELEDKNETFKKSRKPKVIVSALHRDLENTFGERYNRAVTKNTNYKSDFELFSSILLKSLSKYFDNDFEDSLNKDEFRIKAFKIIKELRNDNDEKIIDELSELLDGLVIDKELLQNNYGLCIEIKELLKSNFSNGSQTISDQSVYNDGEDISLATIHSVKGETHKATLLMLDSEFSTGYGDSSTSYSMLQLLEKYLTKNYVELPQDKSDMEKETEKALKLAYVALSRPTHLICIGIPEYKVTENENLLNVFKSAGWMESS
ncbi:UvrD-helicase domain-containing protein [uncultured Streptococcus sp.]|uniref:UvrD-helicase domain-containing protein n=1 Tax=uncultured Streptococcus sp. TaxID=83427 RepID=UPI00261CAB05|nr:UvrD-helicase domain-containing protein [uncultured Streptococcus sp.]